MKLKEDGAPRLAPCRKPSSFFSLRILRALAGSVVAVAALGLVFSLAPRRSDIPGETAAGGGMPEGVMYLHEGPRHLAERREPRELEMLSDRLARDLADRVRYGGMFSSPPPFSERGDAQSRADGSNMPEPSDKTDGFREKDKDPLLVIVIDDLGENMAHIRRLLALPYPVTLAIWPGATHAGKSAELAHAAGRRVLVHMPMQPCDPRQKMGKFGLTVDMPESGLASRLRQALARVPHAVGINNHMGSCFTSDEISVSRFCRELRRQAPDFLVLDSLTLDTSVLYEQAQKQEFRAFRRDVFLDDIAERKAVLRELDKAAVLARRNGMAVAIGHPYPETLAALAVWKGYSRPDLKVGDFPDVGQP